MLSFLCCTTTWTPSSPLPHQPLRAHGRLAPVVACTSDLKIALDLAVAREDYAEAQRLKKEIDAAAAQDTQVAAQRSDEGQAFLLEASSIDAMLASAGKGVVVLHWTAPEHSMSNSMVERVASRYAGSQLAGGTPVAFVQLSEQQGLEQLGKAQMYVDPRKAVSGQAAVSLDAVAPPPPPPLPQGWRQAIDPNSGRAYYISPERETTWEPPLTAAAAAARKLLVERGIGSLPTTQIWKGGEVVAEVGSMTLEAALVELGARPVTGSGASFATGNERLRDRDKGSGLPSATAVDDMDFSGGRANYGGTAFNTKYNDVGRTTGDYLPGLTDKPGDRMGDDGPVNDNADKGPLDDGRRR